MKSSIKPFIEFGPVVVFFIYFYKTGKIQDAILPLMIAAAVAIVLSFIIDRKVSPMLLFSTILIFIFGFLSLKFNSPTFIQLKVTIVNLIFSIILFLGFFLKRPFLTYRAENEGVKLIRGKPAWFSIAFNNKFCAVKFNPTRFV